MTNGRAPKKKFTHIADILAETLQGCRRETNDYLVQMDACWRQVVGETLGEHSHPAAMKGKLLLVHVSSSVWLQEMRFQKAGMIEAINQLLGQPIVGDIKFKIA